MKGEWAPVWQISKCRNVGPLRNMCEAHRRVRAHASSGTFTCGGANVEEIPLALLSTFLPLFEFGTVAM